MSALSQVNALVLTGHDLESIEAGNLDDEVFQQVVLPIPDAAPIAHGDRVLVGCWSYPWGAGWLDGVAEVLDGPDEAGECLIQWVGDGAVSIRPACHLVKLVTA